MRSILSRNGVSDNPGAVQYGSDEAKRHFQSQRGFCQILNQKRFILSEYLHLSPRKSHLQH
jgi:hypothetical protein